MRSFRSIPLGFAASLALACTTTGTLSSGQEGAPDGGGAALCALPDAPSGCGTSCTADALCAAGLHCAAGACVAECWDGRDCPDEGFDCTARGRCVDPTAIPDGGGVDAFVPDGGSCAEISVTLDAVVPNVVFILDRSGSMTEDFRETDDSRWDTLRGALFAEPAGPGDPGGIVYDLDGVVRFGMTLYTFIQGRGLSCPVLVEEAIGLGNYATLRDTYDDNDPPGNGDTPTGDSIRAILASLPSELEDPVLFVVATDGAPDRCEDPNGHDEISEDLSVEAVSEAFTAGVETFMISLGPVGQRHMQDMANAGAGLPVKPREDGDYVEGVDPMADWYDPNDNAGLREDLSTIVSGALSCDLEVEGRLDPDRVCEGTLLVDGAEVPCDDPGGGWRAKDDRTIELLGALCDDLKAGRVETVEGRFPCDVVLE